MVQMHSMFVEENYILPKLTYRLNTIAITISGFNLWKTDTLVLKLPWKHESSRRAKTNLKKNKVGRTILSNLKTYQKPAGICTLHY